MKYELGYILKQEKLIFLLILLVYLLLPNNNSSLDAYYYAASVKYNENLFLPHHLLNNAFTYSLYYPFKTLEIDVLWFSKIINSIFSIVNLYIFYNMLSLLKISKKEKIFYILLIAFSFSFWRYGTENEAYIIPITFSLLGSFYFLKYLNSNNIKYILLSGLFASIACLFHQIHFFWWFGLLIGFFLHKRNTILLYIATAVIVPIVYILVLMYSHNQELTFSNLTHFIFYDFYAGSAKTEFGWKNFFFVTLNSVRTFFQIHPNIYILIKKSFLYILPILFLIFLLFNSLKALLKKQLLKIREVKNSHFIKVHFMILILQLAFAFYAVGNIEFMVMTPFLLFLSIFIKYKLNYRVLSLLTIILFIWNFSYGILPNNNLKYYNDAVLVDFIIKHPNDIFIVKNRGILNKFYYKTGIDNYQKIILSEKINTELQLEKIIRKNRFVYTDVIDKPSIFNRAKVVNLESFELNFEAYNKEKVTSYEGLYGTSVIYKLSKVD